MGDSCIARWVRSGAARRTSLAKTCERTKLFGCHMHLFGILLQLFILIPN